MINYSPDYADEPLKARLIKESSSERFSDKKLGYKILKNAVVLPCKKREGWDDFGGGVISSEGYEDDSACYTYVRNFGYPYEYDKSSVKTVDETVVYAGMFSKIWGHCLSDNLSLLWFLKSEFYEKYKNCKLVYTAPEGELTKNFVKLLSLIGIDVGTFVRVTVPTAFSEIILPEKCFFTAGKSPDFSLDCYFVSDADMRVTKEYRNLINSAADKVPVSTDEKYDKIYFSRSKFSSWDVGEYKIDKFFSRLGYTVVYPERHTLEEQISMLKRCNHFAATEGSASHNSVFLKPGTEVILLARAGYVTPHSFALNAVNGVKATFVSANLSILVLSDWPNAGPYFYYVSDNLLKYFGKEKELKNPEYWIYNLRDFKDYLLKLEPKYYEDRIADKFYYVKSARAYATYLSERKKVFPYCLLRFKYLPARIKKLLKK